MFLMMEEQRRPDRWDGFDPDHGTCRLGAMARRV